VRGRFPPVPVIFALPRAGDPSQAIDADYFEQHPGTHEYTRLYIAGKTVEPMPPGTWVRVMLRGSERVRGFAPPNAESMVRN
jgi:hypothetical protein